MFTMTSTTKIQSSEHRRGTTCILDRKVQEDRRGMRTIEKESRVKKEIHYPDKRKIQTTKPRSLPLWKDNLSFGETSNKQRQLKESEWSTKSRRTTYRSSSCSFNEEDTSRRSRERECERRRDRELKEFKEQVQKTKGKRTTMQESMTRYSDTLFASWILEIRMPMRFTMMEQPTLRTILRDTRIKWGHCVMFKGFSSTRTRIFKRWYSTLPERSIKFFSSLATKFVNHFKYNWKKKKEVDDLQDMKQGTNESLRQYV